MRFRTKVKDMSVMGVVDMGKDAKKLTIDMLCSRWKVLREVSA